jgi:WD40-like Beta Propeller Repeat
MKRIPAGGGAAVDIVPISGFPAGASWGPDNRIVFAEGAYPRLQVVDFQGGSVETISAVESGRNPDALADGRTVLFESDGWIQIVDRVTGNRARLAQGNAPRYALGHVIFSRRTTLFAVPIDLSRQQLTGPVVPLVEGVAFDHPGSGGGRHYESSKNGMLAYVSAADAYELVIVSPDRSERLVTERQRLFENPRFSPNGKFIVVATTRRDGESPDLWMHEFDTGTATRLTSNGGRTPVWTLDGTDVTYSQLGEGGGIYSKRADNQGEAKRLLALDVFHWLVGWTPDQRTLVYALMDKTPSSIMAYRDGQSSRVVGNGSTWGGRLSRDGRLLVYYRLESGAFEVYVTPFPDAGTRWLIAEGTDPTWSPDGSEVYYRSGSRLMAARVDKTAGVRVTSRRLVIEPFLPPLYDDYDIHPDGRTLVIVRPANATQGREVAIVLNWQEALRQQLSQR